MSVYSIKTQLLIGKAYERHLDAHFSDRYRIYGVTYSAQVAGWDRMFIDRATGERTKVEYKADMKAHETGNAFIELGSRTDDTHEWRDGWALTSQADLLYFYRPGPGLELVYIFSPEVLRAELPRWRRMYPEGRSPNKDGYHTHGLLVPPAELELIAQEVVLL